MNETSTWGQDCERGLAHPDSVAARRARIEAYNDEQARTESKFSHALHLLRDSLVTREQLIVLLHCAGSTLIANETPISGEIEEAVRLIDELADALEFTN